MSNTNKLGPYVNRLMTTILDKDQEAFVRELAMNELSRLKVNIEEFLVKHFEEDGIAEEKPEKQLLQEDENVSNK